MPFDSLETSKLLHCEIDASSALLDTLLEGDIGTGLAMDLRKIAAEN
jgi:hypothetical protein